MLDFARTPRKTKALGILPLVDIAMFLLIFFMLAGTIEKFDIIDVEPPMAQSGKLVEEGHMIILLGAREEIVVDDVLVNMDGMEAIVRTQVAPNPRKVITIKADAAIPAVRMVQVMERIKLAGGRNLSIATRSDRSPTPRSAL